MRDCAYSRFISTAAEREAIRLRRYAGDPAPWTADQVMARGRFCNVWREHDKTSRVILQVLGKYEPEQRPALTIGLRLINRFVTLAQFNPLSPLKEELDRLRAVGVNTNAYRLNTPLGLNNKAGLALLTQRALDNSPALWEALCSSRSFRQYMEASMKATGLSTFIAYQAALDLRDLRMTEHMTDDWAYPGPGCIRGLLRLDRDDVPTHWLGHNYRNPDRLVRGRDLQAEMTRLSDRARADLGWERWSIHETEGWLCEYDKYERMALSTPPK